MNHIVTVFALASVGVTARAETDFTNLTEQERAIFHSEIRAVLSSNPELADTRTKAPSLYDDDVASDLALIEKWSQALFAADLPGVGPQDAEMRIALFLGNDCDLCKRAEDDLVKMASEHDLRVTFLDADRHSKLARAMGLDTLPFYVFPKMMLRGHMPTPVLERYLISKTGQ